MLRTPLVILSQICAEQAVRPRIVLIPSEHTTPTEIQSRAKVIRSLFNQGLDLDAIKELCPAPKNELEQAIRYLDPPRLKSNATGLVVTPKQALMASH